MTQRTNLTIEGMSCDHCVRAVRQALQQVPGLRVGDVSVGSATVEYDPAAVTTDQLADALADEGYTLDSATPVR